MRNEKIIPIEIYTDGSCKKMANRTFGAWAFVVVVDNELKYYASESFCETTNQRMELLAAIEALKYISEIKQPNERVIIYSDSAYLINCYEQEWWVNWRNNGWRNANKKEVANQDLWWELIPYFEKFGYDFRKVKGHSTSIWNNKCDELAQKAAEEAKINWRGKENE